ncbi:aldo/keto reductase [Macrococcus equipercicus]|uniref:Aldo/keto reductase n=1 Tax=Macrococcus equipercicus TaxID=69967 RepID=A0ABQ6RAU7_9STAP|nr:aldo/keto reductase [Macrococcus equipercicus]KAA1040382.1 aldo/keto reductase [Macrococcus equipercicus]
MGLGCMNLPHRYNDAALIMNTAIDQGINYFDTADLYDKGKNEELIGKFLKEHNKRSDIIIASKVGNAFNYEDDDVKWDPSRAHILSSVKESLRRLGTDYLDLYMLHGGMIEDNKDETIDAFNTLKRDGLIRTYGISSIRPNVIDYYLNHSDIDVVMMQFNMIDNRPEMLTEAIAAHDVKILARGPVMKGLLTDNYAEVIDRKFKDGVMDYSREELTETLTKAAQDAPLTESAIRYLLNQPVASIVSGASSVDQLTTNLAHYEQVSNSKTTTRDHFKDLDYKDHLS